MFEPDFSKHPAGLIPVIVQDFQTGEILMQAYMNREAWLKTIETKIATYWSRSRQELWVKGATSGHIQHIKEILVDCDDDCLVLQVQAVGGIACHTGHRSCFYRRFSFESGMPENIDDQNP